MFYFFITMDIWRCGILWCYIWFFLANCEESLNKLLSPDPDHPRGGQSHEYTPSCKNAKSIGAIVFELLRVETDRQTYPNGLRSHSPPGSRVISGGHTHDTAASSSGILAPQLSSCHRTVMCLWDQSTGLPSTATRMTSLVRSSLH